jgi:general secretion pathway protein C
MAAELKPPSSASIGALMGLRGRAPWLELGKRHAPGIVAGLAVLGLAWQAAQLTWTVWSLVSPGQSQSGPTPIMNSAPAASTSVDPQVIANAHLFGVPGATSNFTDPNSLPQAQVNLVLAGTMAFNDPEAGFAIVGETAANGKFYRVGATINGVARLHSVYADRVVIERNGALETLALPRGPSNALYMRTATPATNETAENLRRLANNPQAISNLLRAQPVFANGALKGYRVYPGRDRQQFVRSGLQPGDLVTAINGTNLDDPNRGNEILNTLTSSTTALVAVERNGVIQQVNLDMSQLSIPDATADSTSSSNADNTSGNFMRPPGFGGGPSNGSRGGRNFGNGGGPGGTPDTSNTQ